MQIWLELDELMARTTKEQDKWQLFHKISLGQKPSDVVSFTAIFSHANFTYTFGFTSVISRSFHEHSKNSHNLILWYYMPLTTYAGTFIISISTPSYEHLIVFFIFFCLLHVINFLCCFLCFLHANNTNDNK